MSSLQVSPFQNFKMPYTSAAENSKKEAVASPIRIENSDNTPKEAEAKKSHAKRNVIIGALATVTAGLIIGIMTGKIKLPKFGKAKEAAQQAAKEAAEQAAQEAAKAAQKAAKEADGNIAIGAFAVGLIAKCFKDSQTDDKELEALKKLVIEKEDFIKNTQLPEVQEEAQELTQIYNDKIISKIEKQKQFAQKMYSRYEKDLNTFNNINGNYDKEYLWPDSKVKKADFSQNEDTGAIIMNLYDTEGKKTQTTTFANGVPIEIVAYNNELPQAKGRFVTNADAKAHMTHFYVYDKDTANPAGTLSFDENENIKTYLNYTKDGKLDNVYFLNGETQELNSVCVPNDEGTACAKQYIFRNQKLRSAEIRDNKGDLPKHIYHFDENQKPVSMDVFGKDKHKLEVPFEIEAKD